LVRVLKLTTDELILKNEEPVYKLGLSCTSYKGRVPSLEFLNAGLLYLALLNEHPVLFGEGAFGLLFSCRERAFR
jgi:hypothetical protein